MTTLHLCTPCLVCKLHLKGTASSLQRGPAIRYWRAEFLLRLSDVNTTIYSPVKSAPKSECPLFLRADIMWSSSFLILRPALSFLPAATSSPLSWTLSLWDFKSKDHTNPSFLRLFLPGHFTTAIEGNMHIHTMPEDICQNTRMCAVTSVQRNRTRRLGPMESADLEFLMCLTWAFFPLPCSGKMHHGEKLFTVRVGVSMCVCLVCSSRTHSLSDVYKLLLYTLSQFLQLLGAEARV